MPATRYYVYCAVAKRRRKKVYTAPFLHSRILDEIQAKTIAAIMAEEDKRTFKIIGEIMAKKQRLTKTQKRFLKQYEVTALTWKETVLRVAKALNDAANITTNLNGVKAVGDRMIPGFQLQTDLFGMELGQAMVRLNFMDKLLFEFDKRQRDFLTSKGIKELPPAVAIPYELSISVKTEATTRPGTQSASESRWEYVGPDGKNRWINVTAAQWKPLKKRNSRSKRK
jgi:hypothetical protein